MNMVQGFAFNIPGEGGEEPLELALFAGVSMSDASAPKLPDEGGLVMYSFVFRT